MQLTQYSRWMILGLLVLLVACGQQENSVEVNEGNLLSSSTTEPAPIIVEMKQLATVTLLSDRIKVQMPIDFAEMSEEAMKIKYPLEQRPKLVYTNENGSINLAVKQTQDPLSDKALLDYKNFILKTFKQMYPSATWYGDDVIEVQGQKVGYIELLTPAVDTSIYNLMWFTVMDGKALIVSFNCTEAHMQEWQSTAHEIMKSFTIQEEAPKTFVGDEDLTKSEFQLVSQEESIVLSLGLLQEEVEALLGPSLEYNDFSQLYTYDGIQVYYHEGKVSALKIDDVTPNPMRFKTARDFGVGSSYEDVRLTYGDPGPGNAEEDLLNYIYEIQDGEQLSLVHSIDDSLEDRLLMYSILFDRDMAWYLTITDYHYHALYQK